MFLFLVLAALSPNVLCFLRSSGDMNYKFDTVASIPKIFYGTAWKKEHTASLVAQAITSGFRAIDTACQPKHYSESGVGEGLKTLIKAGSVQRSDLFIQTKFTGLNGQDPNRIPYDKNAPIVDRVRQSFAVSLQNLHTDYLDSLMMHSPMDTHEETLQVWRVFEEFHAQGKVHYLGISNIYSLESLKLIYDAANVKPTFIQNRFYADSGHDTGIRSFCLEKGMKYQSFWTLTANNRVVKGYVQHMLCSVRTRTVLC